jgi:hypothetical protein
MPESIIQNQIKKFGTHFGPLFKEKTATIQQL